MGAGDYSFTKYGGADIRHRHPLDIIPLYAVNRYRISRNGYSRWERLLPSLVKRDFRGISD